MSAAAAALVTWLSVAGALAADSASVMIVFDASGSMAGLLEPKARKTKINLARDSLQAALSRASPQTRIGLAVFGERGGCRDVDIARTPEPIDIEATIAPLTRLRPRGKGPLTLALREAAKRLPDSSAGPRSVLLIHDGVDNCRQDVCEAAAELKAAGIAAHVVSLGLDDDDLAKMACLPRVTGGRHFKVKTSEEADAAIGEALRVAGNAWAGVGLTPASPSVPWATSVVPPPPIPATGSTALHLRALLAPKTEPLGVPLHWTVSRKDQPESVLLDALTANPVVAVGPGKYVVSVRNDLVSASRSVTVHGDRPVAVPIVLGAGALRVRVAAQRTGAPLADAVITVSAADGAPLTVFRASEAATLLPPGRFRISAELGLVRSERTVSVTEGSPTDVEMVLNVGRLQLTTEGRDGGAPLEAPLFIVMEDDPPRGRREVARSAASQAEFGLPPGTYYIVARQGGVETRERLAIGPGAVERRVLGAAVGRLSLSTSGPGPLAGNLVSYSVRRLDDPYQDTIWTSRPAPLLLLPAGRYRVEARYGLTNVVTTRDVEVEAGQTSQLPIEHQAARLMVRLAGIGARLADVSWEVLDEAGRVIWASTRAEDAALVQAGRYVVRADTSDKHEERTVELQVGDAKLVEIRAE